MCNETINTHIIRYISITYKISYLFVVLFAVRWLVKIQYVSNAPSNIHQWTTKRCWINDEATLVKLGSNWSVIGDFLCVKGNRVQLKLIDHEQETNKNEPLINFLSAFLIDYVSSPLSSNGSQIWKLKIDSILFLGIIFTINFFHSRRLAKTISNDCGYVWFCWDRLLKK